MAKGLSLDDMDKAYSHRPKCISFRNVINEGAVSWWTEWEGISQDISMEEFFTEIRKCNLDPERLVIRSYIDEDGGILLDYGLRKQFYIPHIDSSWDLNKLSIPINERVNTDSITLANCPFCGSKPVLSNTQEMCSMGDEGWVIVCSNEECNFSTVNVNGRYSYRLDELIKRWNRRA